MTRSVVRYSEAFKLKVVNELESGKFSGTDEARKSYGIKGPATVIFPFSTFNFQLSTFNFQLSIFHYSPFSHSFSIFHFPFSISHYSLSALPLAGMVNVSGLSIFACTFDINSKFKS